MKAALGLILFMVLPIQATENIAILDFQGKNVTQAEASVLSDKLRAEVSKLNKFQIMERDAMEQILKEQGFQQSGCTSTECAVEVGQLVGVRKMIAGTVGKVGSTFLLTMRIIDVATGKVLESYDVDIRGSIDDALVTGMPRLASKMINKQSGAIASKQPVKQQKTSSLKPLQKDTLLFNDGLAKKKMGNKWGFVDRYQRIQVQAKYDDAGHFSNGLAAVKKRGKWGYIDVNGKLRIDFQYNSAKAFDGAVAPAKSGEWWISIDTLGEIANAGNSKRSSKQIECNSEIGYQPMKVGKLWGFADTLNKEMAIAPQYDEVKAYKECFAAVSINDKWGFVDGNGDIAIYPIFERVRSFSDGRAACLIGSEWGFLDKMGNIVIPWQFADVDDFAEGKAKVVKQGADGHSQRYLIDLNGGKVFQHKKTIISKAQSKLENLSYYQSIDGHVEFLNDTISIVKNGIETSILPHQVKKVRCSYILTDKSILKLETETDRFSIFFANPFRGYCGRVSDRISEMMN